MFREAAKRALTAAGIGTLGEKAASAIADFIVVDMFANYCTGREDAKGAIADRRTAAEAHLSLRVNGRARLRPPIATWRDVRPRPYDDGIAELQRISFMADIALQARRPSRQIREATAWDQLRTNRNWLGFWFMLPATAFLILFLAYPLGLGVWMSFTDAKIGRPGEFIGIENYEWLWGDSIFWLSVFNTLLYTSIASAIKFAVGLYLALLLNENMPFKAMLRALVLIPFIVPTVLSAIAFWWIFDCQFSIISWSLQASRPDHPEHQFPRRRHWARICVIFANIWRGVPFVAITLLAGLQTV